MCVCLFWCVVFSSVFPCASAGDCSSSLFSRAAVATHADAVAAHAAAAAAGVSSQLLLCTGSSPRRLSGVKGMESSGVFYLRDVADLVALRDSLFGDANTPQSLKHVIVGSSFIGIEIAAALKKLGVKDISVIGKVSRGAAAALCVLSRLLTASVFVSLFPPLSFVPLCSYHLLSS